MLVAGLGFIPSSRVTAQTFTTLYSFSAIDDYVNSDGADPVAGLILSGNTLYGTANYGGSGDNGTVFKVNTDGTGFTTLYNFTALNLYCNSDGAYPYAGLILSGNTLYGTTSLGGTNGNGTVFAVNTDGTGFTTLHIFTANPMSFITNSDGADPLAGLILSGNTLYGTAYEGGTNGYGTVFAVNTDGTGFTNLHSFTAVDPIPTPTATELIRWPDWFYRATPCMGRRIRRQFGLWHGVRRQHRWHRFYEPA